jgi:hypothetical protein
MLLRLIFISVNAGLSTALFALLFLILVRLDTLLTVRLPKSQRPLSGSSSYTRPISSTQHCTSHSARRTATRSSLTSTCVRSSEVAVRDGNSIRFRCSSLRTWARNEQRYRASPGTLSAALHTYTLTLPLSEDSTFGLLLCARRPCQWMGGISNVDPPCCNNNVTGSRNLVGHVEPASIAYVADRRSTFVDIVYLIYSYLNRTVPLPSRAYMINPATTRRHFNAPHVLNANSAYRMVLVRDQAS